MPSRSRSRSPRRAQPADANPANMQLALIVGTTYAPDYDLMMAARARAASAVAAERPPGQWTMGFSGEVPTQPRPAAEQPRPAAEQPHVRPAAYMPPVRPSGPLPIWQAVQAHMHAMATGYSWYMSGWRPRPRH